MHASQGSCWRGWVRRVFCFPGCGQADTGTGVVLEKDPARRFQNPAELLDVMTLVRDAIDAERRLVRAIRVFVSSTGDVQKERILADRLIRSIAAEFNIRVSASESNLTIGRRERRA
jgi:hypothetical protein